MSGPANLILIGPMGSGKSSVARGLARATHRRWVDTDKMVVDQTRLPIAEIFSLHGEDYFRAHETAALRSIVPGGGLIVATGGGIVTRAENTTLLQRLGTVVWLTAREEVLFERVSRNRHRPLLHTVDPRATLHELLVRRRPLYESCAHLTVDTSDASHAALVEIILARTGIPPAAPASP